MILNVLTCPSNKYRLEGILSELKEYEIKIHIGLEETNLFNDLANTVKNIIRENYENPYCIIVEDDHVFAREFNLNDLIHEGFNINADMIIGGVKCFTADYNYYKNGLAKIINFRGSQFIIYYRSSYDRILSCPPNSEMELYLSYSRLNKYVPFPFISYQKDGPSRFLGYVNNMEEFSITEKSLENLLKYYKIN